MYTTLDKAIAAFFGSIIAILGFLGWQVPAFFTSASWTQLMTIVLPALIPFIMTWLATNKPAA